MCSSSWSRFQHQVLIMSSTECRQLYSQVGGIHEGFSYLLLPPLGSSRKSWHLLRDMNSNLRAVGLDLREIGSPGELK